MNYFHAPHMVTTQKPLPRNLEILTRIRKLEKMSRKHTMTVGHKVLLRQCFIELAVDFRWLDLRKQKLQYYSMHEDNIK